MDTLANGAACKRDVAFLLQLRINVVRVSNVDITKDHTECLNAFADAGIYVLAELRSPSQWMEPKPEWTRWDIPLFEQYLAVVEQLSKFTNVLGFVVGDTGDRAENSPGLPFYKAAVRDIRELVKQRSLREVPIGWILGSPFLAAKTTEQLDYMTCEDPRVDFMAVGLRETNNDGCTKDLRINETASVYKDAPVPTFLYDHGCSNQDSESNQPRECFILMFFKAPTTRANLPRYRDFMQVIFPAYFPAESSGHTLEKPSSKMISGW